ncbi:MAG: hypothetical protein HYR56_29235 [Acidobacteria bacterium]|nr:hypothetical protein [Acidobacteriota bacterium]MBI3425327.1 hypothetical protein [Acidobacteriota bacterium]
MPDQPCEQCGTAPARLYQQLQLHTPGVPSEESLRWYCVTCARAERSTLREQESELAGLTRDELIAKLDRFFAASGVFEICGRCHAQGTGCCPPTCRIIEPQGCVSGKTLFCATFLCSALLNAISECEPELGRTLKWLKREVGVAEWRIYQMFTRVPAAERDAERPLVLPQRYPDPGELDGERLKPKLAALADEVLEMRRRWHVQEERERTCPTSCQLVGASR